MKKKVTFAYKIGLIMLIMLSMVGVVGIYTYQKFTAIVINVSELTRPDLRIVTAKAILSDLTDAENKVKSFSITEDTIYLNQFYQIVERTEDKLDKLRDQNSERVIAINIDTLDALIEDKVGILQELLLLQDEFRVQEALDKVVAKIEKTSLPANVNKTEEKSGLFNNVFKRKKTKDSIDKSQITLSDISKEVSKVKKEEKSIEMELRQKELALITADNKVSLRIRKMLEDFEKSEVAIMEKETNEAALAVDQTNKQIAIFCIVLGVLICFMAFVIINYVRANNRFRKALKKAKKEAENLAEAKERFLANMSHEIRTPMNAINGFTEQIAKGPLTDEQRIQMNMVQKSTEHLLYLVNDVLDFTKLQNGKVNLEMIGFEPIAVINDVCNFVKPMASDKDLMISCEFNEGISPYLIGDPFRLRQILLNLLSNSIKFTEYGAIKIIATPVLLNKDSMHLRMEISDTGIGMNPQQIKKVFQEFEQAEVSTTRNYGGTGLGLSITKMLINLHDGTIDINSNPGEGTTLVIEIPYKIGKKEDVVLIRQKKISTSFLNGLKILIVDDESYNRKLLTTILKKYNVILTEVTNGEEAVYEASRNKYDVILMDARMPVLNGLEASEAIRKLEGKISTVPIIALSAAVSEDDKLKYKSSGMNGFLAKPFSERELILEIGKIIAKVEEAPLEKIETVIEKVTVPRQTLEFSELRKISNQDVKFYKDMLETFISGTVEGMDSIEVKAKEEEWESVADYAHRISAPCKHLSALNLHSMLKEIEKRCRSNSEMSSIKDLIESAKSECSFVIDEVKKELSLH